MRLWSIVFSGVLGAGVATLARFAPDPERWDVSDAAGMAFAVAAIARLVIEIVRIFGFDPDRKEIWDWSLFGAGLLLILYVLYRELA